ncbi:MAG: LLM class F420-dependent oxidoreductase [Candidatus Geothermarchaeales archaeon]
MEFEGWGSRAEEVEEMRRFALKCEELGFDSIWLYDHFLTVPKPTLESSYECWTTTAWLAGVTKKIRIGQMVTCNSYRHPSVLAKMSSTVDALSGGRLDMGIGAGWYQAEYNAYGIPFPKASVRIGMLDEAAQIIKRMWTENSPSFEGRYYSIKEAMNNPKPVQKPHPPLWIGGGGEQLTLRVVAEHADYSNFHGGEDPIDGFKHKMDILQRHCEEVGRGFEEIKKSTLVNVLIGRTEAEVDERIAKRARAMGVAEAEYRKRLRMVLSGTPETCVERWSKLMELGASYFVLYILGTRDEWYDTLELLVDSVIPELR